MLILITDKVFDSSQNYQSRYLLGVCLHNIVKKTVDLSPCAMYVCHCVCVSLCVCVCVLRSVVQY